MRFAAAGRRERTLALDMTPMIDIVFQLLIFFLTTTQLARSAEQLLDLPREEGSKETRGASPFTVNLLADGSLQLGDRAISLDELRRVAARSAGDPPVVRADRAAPAESLNALVRALRDAGGASVRLAVDPPARGGESP